MPHAYDPWSHHKHHAPVEEETEEETEGEVTGGEETEAEVTEEEVEPCESGVTQLTVDFANEYGLYRDGFGELVVGSEIFIEGPLAAVEAFVWNEQAADGNFTFSFEGTSQDGLRLRWKLTTTDFSGSSRLVVGIMIQDGSINPFWDIPI